MTRVFLLPTVLLVAAGCLGSGSARHGASSPRVLVEPNMPAGASVRVVYPVGPVRPSAALVGGCPQGATCRAVRIPCGEVKGCTTGWRKVATRRLTCSPDAGGYSNPSAACAALRDLERRERHHTGSPCFCPLILPGPRAHATGTDRRHPVHLALDPCSVCGTGPHGAADLRVLVPV